jgi:hypothetical protein
MEITIACSDGNKCTVAVKRGRNRNISVALTGKIVGERLMDMDHPFTVYAPRLAGIPKEERYMSPGAVRRVVARGDANLVLRNVLLMLKKKGDAEVAARLKLFQEKKILGINSDGWESIWISFQRNMKSLFPGIEIEVKFDEERDENIEVFFTRPGRPRLPIDAAGTSVLQASQILAYITLFNPSVLILDEPDSHLHPNNQRMLCNLITELANQRGFRALISTHSRHVLDALQDSAEVVWINSGKKVEYDSVSTASMLMEIGALDSVDYFANGQLRCLFATEDSSKDSLKALRVLFESNGFVAKETDIHAYGGCSKIDAAKVLRGFLQDRAPKVKFVLHRDRDYMDDVHAKRFEDDILALDAKPFLTEFSDVESYFLNAEHLAQINPPISINRAQELIDEATSSTRVKSIESLINIRTESAIRERKGGVAHNPGALAMKANVDYDEDPVKWRRGKIVLKSVVALLQGELKKNPNILQATQHLRTPALEAIRSFVWPNGVEAGISATKSAALTPLTPSVPVALVPPVPPAPTFAVPVPPVAPVSDKVPAGALVSPVPAIPPAALLPPVPSVPPGALLPPMPSMPPGALVPPVPSVSPSALVPPVPSVSPRALVPPVPSVPPADLTPLVPVLPPKTPPPPAELGLKSKTAE